MDAPANAPARTLPSPPGEDRATPMMAQYIEIKAANPDSLLFYRMGDFYELFFDDAEAASRTLGIVLTKRGKHRGEDIPMCGVPVERAEEYLHKLIAAGHRVAVCEQLEDPAEAKKRGPKSVVKRDVTRLVTPGTLTEDALLDARRENVLAALARLRGSEAEGPAYALAFADISTGSFRVLETGAGRLAADLARIEPAELLVPDAAYDDPALKELWRALPAVTPLPKESFDGAGAERRIAGFFGVATLDAFGAFSRAELAAAGAVVAYVERTQLGARPPLSPPVRESAGGTMVIDPATRANLEILRTTTGERTGSLNAAIDRTVTSAGARLLGRRLAEPLTDPVAIARRLDAVEHLVERPALRAALRGRLAGAPDLARALTRIALGRAGPRDLAAIGRGLAEGAVIAGLLREEPPPAELDDAARDLVAAPPELAALLAAALAEELPPYRRDGGFVRTGFSPDLDATRGLRDESRRVVAALERRYAEETGLRALKIRHNAVLGYFVEVSAQNADRLREPPFAAVFVHRQTMAGAVRFSSVELGELEAKIASAGERALALEQGVFEDLAARIVAEAETIRAAAGALAVVDVTAGLAEIAVSEAHVRPLVDDGLDFRIEGGRHPVVEPALRRGEGAGSGGPFVANDCDLSPPERAKAGRIWLVTGPNMAGKSTFLRQNALIAILAQAGAFVPASSAHIGVVDRLFSRVGAADDLARGRSTFMVEMVETAAILNQATQRSLVILDEIGRGTATFDGLSIAWASLEHLHEANRCRGLFATHFHELTALSQRLPRLVNATVKVKEWHGEVIFLHEVVPGAADRSYGIQVAKLAGLPPAVVERARAVLAELESADRAAPTRRILDDLPLFAALNRPAPAAAVAADPAAGAVKDALTGLDPDGLTPREALEALYRLKGLLRG
ncbi:DNA mismatch repair protein MutS [Ancylobacter terrae]|uniref:DNA mismatch repair protein MutS n=1 Tax=Ancylobacter sp. sgz301288 TaxID=3342077 RepID=UPI00385C8D2D